MYAPSFGYVFKNQALNPSANQRLEFLNSMISSCTLKADGDTLQPRRKRVTGHIYIFFEGETESRMRGKLGQRGDRGPEGRREIQEWGTWIDRLMSYSRPRAGHQQVRGREWSHGLRLYLLSGSRPLGSQSVRGDGGRGSKSVS